MSSQQITVLLIAKASVFYLELKQHLKAANIGVRQAECWDPMLLSSDTGKPRMIILNCSGANVDGLVCYQEIRNRYAGLLMLVSEHAEERFHLLALDMGADASLPSTAGAPLVAANVKALLRRFAPVKLPMVLTFGNLAVDANRRDVFVAGQAAQLSTIEFRLFWFLAQKPGCVVSRDELYRELHNTDYNRYDRSIDVYMSRIRQKIGDDPATSHYLKTVRGVGYQLMSEGQQVPGTMECLQSNSG